MCGVVGIMGNDYVAQDLYDCLITLQHRGQDACGIATFDGAQFNIHKGLGLVRDTFDEKAMMGLKGSVGVAHVRYPTVGGTGIEDAQPFLSFSPYGTIMAHNGNLINFHELKKEIGEKDLKLINSNCDIEVILSVMARALRKQKVTKNLKPSNVFRAVKDVYKRAKGSYSVVGYIANQGMVAFRDPHGIRPLLWGKRETGLQTEYIFASEKVTLDILGFELIRDVKAGEVIFITPDRKVHTKMVERKRHTPCIFEYIYFARPDSLLDSVSVHKMRLRLGERLAKKIKKMKFKIDVVIPVPDSARSSAIGLADKLNIRFREGLVKNRYIGRTFIMPGQEARKKSIRYKLNALPLEIKGKNVLLVDDSIVRGNTSKQIIEMVRQAGAKKVYIASTAPPVKNPCMYGIDMPTYEELIAHNLEVDEIRTAIGADELIYQDIPDMTWAAKKGNPKITKFCQACFDGKYITPEINAEMMKKHADIRCYEKKYDEKSLTEQLEKDQSTLI